MHAVAKSLVEIEDELNQYFLERKDVIRATLLAVLSGEHLFMLGPPGVAKSLIIRTFVATVLGVRYFEAQLSKQRPAEAILGPLDIQEFRTNGNYFLKRKGYATQCEFVMLDEIGKGSPVLWNDLLALANERVYHEVNGGRSVHPAPLSTLFSASNEMITDQSDDAAAMWDRLLVRVFVDDLKDKRNFARLLTIGKPNIAATVSWDELHAVITHDVPAVTISDETIKKVVALRSEFKKHSLLISARRWRASMKLLQASAFLAGRTETDDTDLAVLRFALWDTVEQMEKVHELCMSASNRFVKPLGEIRTRLREVEKGVDERKAGEAGAKWSYGQEAGKKLDKVRDELDLMLIEAGGEPIPGFKAVSDQHERVSVNTYMVCLEQPYDNAVVMASKKLGSGDGGNQ